MCGTIIQCPVRAVPLLHFHAMEGICYNWVKLLRSPGIWNAADTGDREIVAQIS